MTIRQVEAGQGLAWYTRALDLGGRNPRALFGGALLGLAGMMFALVLAAIAAVALALALAGDQAGQPLSPGFLLAFLPLLLFAFVAGPWLVAGVTQLIDDAEQGRATSAMRVFAGLGGGRLWPLAGLALIPLAGLALTLLSYRVFGGPDYLTDYAAMISQISQGGVPVPPEPAHPVLMFFAGLLLSALQYVLQLLTVPAVQLGGRGTLTAIAESFQAVLRNPGAMVVMLLVGFAGMIGLGVVLVLVLAVLAILAALLPVLGLLLGLPLMLVLAAVLLVVFCGVGYHAWRDLMADPASAPPLPLATGIEV